MLEGQGTRRILRSTQGRWLGGVCGGLAEHLGTQVALIRLLFALTALVGGVGVLAYALLWMFLPLAEDDRGPGPASPSPSWDLTGILGLLAIALGTLLVLAQLGLPIQVSLWAPALLVGVGVAVLWRQGDDSRLMSWRPSMASVGGQRGDALRVIVGLGLVLLGVAGTVIPRVDPLVAAQTLVAAGAVTAGMLVIALPWLRAWLRRRQEERSATIRAEERAEMAARVHDSVLQTLTLIQRRSTDAAEVSRLARAEERALRAWLYAPEGPSGTLAAALAEVCRAAEADYDVRIELVTVGDAMLDDRLAALVAATREAVVNAAKHAGSPATVYAELAGDTVEVNVRDRGRGFEPAAVGADRHGLRESITSRVRSVGGDARIRSAPGEGTEVRLTLPIGGR